MSSPRPVLALLAAGLSATLAATTLAGGSPSSAAEESKPQTTTVAKGLLSPLSVAFGEKRAVYYSENFAGKLWVKKPGKSPRLLYTSSNGAEVGAISTRDDIVYFVSGSRVLRRKSAKDVKVVANIGKYEKARNPDAGVSYGPQGLTPECAAAWPTGEGAPPGPYTGIVESHPYATAYGDGALYVADAAANAIFRVRKGKIRTVAVLPPTSVTISADMAADAGIPECAVGKQYRFEGVPTDVEFANGKLWVSSLPGGPEDGSVPGGVYKVNPRTGNTVRYASGLVSANGLAVTREGVYVAELFAGKITLITPRKKKVTFARTDLPSAVEVRGSRIYATDNVLVGFGPGEAPGGRVIHYRR